MSKIKSIRSVMDNEGPEVEVNIYQSFALAQNNGRVPEHMVAKYIAEALDKSGLNALIRNELKLINPPGEKSVCGNEFKTLSWWQEQLDGGKVAQIAKDANILILNSGSGGCGTVNGNAATTCGKMIDEWKEYEPVGSGEWHGNMQVNLHELGHCLGASHDFEQDRSGDQHAGMGWNEETAPEAGFYHTTPCLTEGGSKNRCGENVEEQRFDRKIFHQYYWRCAEDVFNVA